MFAWMFLHHLFHVPVATVDPHEIHAEASRSSSEGFGEDLGNFLITCYDSGSITASGAHVSIGEVAVDPNIIPLGSHLFIGRFGDRIAEDTGGAVRGHHIDMYEHSCANWSNPREEVWKN